MYTQKASKESWIQYSLLWARWIQSEKAVLQFHNKNSVAQKSLTIPTEHNLQIYTKLYDLQKQHNFKCIYSHIQGVPGGMCNTSGECSLC